MSRPDSGPAAADAFRGDLGMALFDLTSDPLVLTDAGGRILAVNRALRALTGLGAQAVDGRPLLALFPEACDADLRRVQAGGTAELALRHADGRHRAYALRCVDLRADDAAPRHLWLLAPAGEVHHGLGRPGDADASIQQALLLAVDAAKVGVYRYDLKTQRVHFNDHGWAQVQLPPRPEGIAVSALNVVHPDDLPAVRAAGERALADHVAVDAQARYLTADGQVRHIFSRRVAQRDATGEAVALVGVVLDLTEQVEQGQRTRRLSERLDELCKALGIGLWSQDVRGLESSWNAPMWALYDLPPQPGPPSLDELLRLRVHPEDRDMVRTQVLTWARSEQAAIETEYRIVRSDGSVRLIAVTARREPTGGRAPIFGIARDITERHAADAALREANARIALAARAVGVGTWQIHLGSGRQQWDENMFRLRGLLPQPEAPDPATQLAALHPDDHAGIARCHDEVLREREPRDYEFRVIAPDGALRTLGARAIPLLDTEGRVTSLLGVNWDVSEARATQQALMARDVAERENRAKSQFLARMSHELRTPLNAVLGFTQLLSAQVRDPRQREHLDHVHLAGEHLLSLINDALDLARVQADELSLELEAVDLDALLPEVLALVAPQARARGIDVAVQATFSAVHADRVRLRQVLLNLLSNAVKYNRDGGRVVVRGGRTGSRVALSVLDTGRGLTEPQLARLFEPFNRLGAEGSGIEGTGIGLAIVKGLVERMNGHITVRSRPGEGSVFALDLPAAERPAADSGAAALPSALEWSSPRVLPHEGRLLYIEDNPVNVMLVAEMIKLHTRFELVTADDGRSGVARARQLRPDLVLIDMHLPDIDGFAVLEQLRSAPATAGLRCVALSANALPDDIARARHAGFDDYWTKPIDLRSFLKSLDALFGPR